MKAKDILSNIQTFHASYTIYPVLKGNIAINISVKLEFLADKLGRTLATFPLFSLQGTLE